VYPSNFPESIPKYSMIVHNDMLVTEFEHFDFFLIELLGYFSIDEILFSKAINIVVSDKKDTVYF
jgi:hypothetical protein